MALSDEDVGLYNDLPPDATVDGYTEDESNPGWVEAHFSDGRTATLPKDHVEQLPQTPSAMPYGAPAAPMGPPLPPEPVGVVPEQEPLLPGELAQTGTPDNPYQAAFEAGGVPLPGAGTGLQIPQGSSGLPDARVNPMAEIVSEGTAGGFDPYSATQSESTTQSSTVDDPAVMQARLDKAATDSANAERMFDMVAYRGRVDALDAELDGMDKQEEQLHAQKIKAELEVAEHRRVVEAIEKEPIDEDGFWSEKPGREAAAWIALALSGFLQGATKGQNPALNQMVQALDGAQDRWLKNQQTNRDSVVRRREKLMGSAENARDSVTMQLNGLVTKKWQTEAQRAGVPVPPAGETYIAKGAVKSANDMNAIGSRIDKQTTAVSQEEARRTAATGPVRRGDVVLQRLGLDEKKKQEAFDPKGADLGGTVKSAERLAAIDKRLEEIKQDFGDLPQQNTVSWSKLGLAGVAGRSGSPAAKAQLEATSLLKEAALMLKQSAGTTKFFDSESERADLEKQIDTGETATSMAAIKRMADKARTSAINTASQFTRDPQGLIDYTRTVQATTAGTDAGQGPKVKRSTGYGAAPQEQSAVEATTGGGPAPRPLATGPQTSTTRGPSATALSQGGTYLRGRFRKPL